MVEGGGVQFVQNAFSNAFKNNVSFWKSGGVDFK